MTQVEQVGHKAKEVLNFSGGRRSDSAEHGHARAAAKSLVCRQRQDDCTRCSRRYAGAATDPGRGTEFATEKLRLVHQSRWEGGYAGDG
jgi:hypothetical protein